VTRKLHNVIVIGAASAIAQAISRLLAERHCRLFLVARDAGKLASVTADLTVRGADMVASAWQQLGTVDAAIIAYGILGDQKEAERNWEEAAAILNVNFTSVASLVTHLANDFEIQGFGQLVGIGSVAGDRGRRTNYLYGAAKAGVETLLAGVRHRLAPKGIAVLLVKPGFVDTPMTAHLPRSPLFASPAYVAGKIVSAMEGGKSTIYVPFFWRPIMWIIRLLPESIFNRLSI
jgi:decaprenylphospho-beta-D-erythro-pentofuranosid-2-ulose 2-reductase